MIIYMISPLTGENVGNSKCSAYIWHHHMKAIKRIKYTKCFAFFLPGEERANKASTQREVTSLLSKQIYSVVIDGPTATSLVM